MQRLLSHAVTELGDTRRNQKISKQGTYPSYLYPKEVGEGCTYLAGLLPQQLISLNISDVRSWWRAVTLPCIGSLLTQLTRYLSTYLVLTSLSLSLSYIYISTHAADKIYFYISSLSLSYIYIFSSRN